MYNNKTQILSRFRVFANNLLRQPRIARLEVKKKAGEINKAIVAQKNNLISEMLRHALANRWTNRQKIHSVLLITYASYIAMLEARNSVWPYEYMAFSRRIGELWEPFCKEAFNYPIKDLRIIEPPDFSIVQRRIRSEAENYIDSLHISDNEKITLKQHYNLPWNLVDSGGIKLDLDLHFSQSNVNYYCDFKSGFSSNEKGNVNRLLLVASIYHFLGNNNKNLIFVRQEEEENNHYLQTLINSQYWEVYCANDTYRKISEFTGVDLRSWIDSNIDWQEDMLPEFRRYLTSNDLIKYLTW